MNRKDKPGSRDGNRARRDGNRRDRPGRKDRNRTRRDGNSKDRPGRKDMTRKGRPGRRDRNRTLFLKLLSPLIVVKAIFTRNTEHRLMQIK